MTLLVPRRLLGALLSAALTAVALVGVAVVAPAAAEAATVRGHGYLLAPGPNLGGGTQWMGSFIVDGRPPAYCIDYGKAAPRTATWRDTRSVAGWSTEQRERIAYIVNKWGGTRSNTGGAAVNAAVNLTIGNRRFLADWRSSYVPQLARKDRAVVPLAYRMIAEAAALHGPYTVSVRVTRAAAVGGTAQARVSVVSARNKPIATGLSIRLGNALAARRTPTRTAANGTATVDLVPWAPGRVSVRASATGLVRPSVVRLSVPTSPAVQRLVSAGVPRTTTTTTGSFRATYPKQALRASLACTQDCVGAPPITVAATNASARNKLQVFLVVNDRTVPGKVLTLAPGRSGSMSTIVRDGNKVRLAYRWQRGSGWTGFLPYGTPSVVECPPAPDLDFAIDCPCQGEIGGTMTDNNTTRYTHVLTVRAPGKADRTLTVPPRSKRSLSGIRWKRGQTLTVWGQSLLDGRKVGPLYRVTSLNIG